MADSFIDDLAKASETSVEGKAPPSGRVVDWIHGNVSTTEPTDVHHRLGFGPNDAAQGDHTHNGRDSKALFSSATILNDLTGASTSAQVAASVNAINALLRSLGAG